jgi:hypothetical protein
MFRTLAVTLVVTLFSVNASFAREWIRLGERHVGFLTDHDKIEVGRFEGRFKRLKLIIRRNDIELNRIKVIFGNGQVEDAEFHRVIREGGEAVLDLRTVWSDGRFIRAVEMSYRSRPDFRGEAVAELWGQED